MSLVIQNRPSPLLRYIIPLVTVTTYKHVGVLREIQRLYDVISLHYIYG